MVWSLYEKDGFLPPLRFSNGKTQEDVVKEVLETIKKGHRIIFIHGVCGTGKSAIALHLAKELGKSSIIVPIKNLQEQYKKDYETDKYVLKKNGEKLKISVITGRKNHECKFIKDNEKDIPFYKKEINANLHDIFEGKYEEIKKQKERDLSADRTDLPCKIEIKEKNINKIREYIKQNKNIKLRNLQDTKDVKRISIASVCPYWSPVISDEYELKVFEDSEKRHYAGLSEKNFIFYQRKRGCKFYEQFNSYIDSDAIIFNSLKYKLEFLLNRKPRTEVEIIDECDEFLDSFSNQKTINLERLQNSLVYVFTSDEKANKIISEMRIILNQMAKDSNIKEAIQKEAIIPIKQTGFYDIFKMLLENKEILEDVDDESYLFDVEETARMFEDFLDETFVIFSKVDKNLFAGIVTTNLAKRFHEIVEKNKVIVLMSGTLHSKDVLDKIFGIKDYKIIEAETKTPGRIEVKRTGLEKDCKYSNFSAGKHNREEYLKALSKCVELAEKPILVHVNAFNDLPDKTEIENLKIHNLMSKEELKESQKNDNIVKTIDNFKKGKIDILFTTRASRGMDFPGDECKSIIFTKYPNPNIRDAFWRILQRTRPQHYWSFYKDKAKRELFQKVYRGLRFEGDHVYVLSPDVRVLDAFSNP